ncbi:hypothetical protein QIW53_21395 [Pseudomonas fluorescens]|jgi:hypothetical protein|uniref:DUF7683 domain-containing protein n=1 Tax=Pseudomonas fluorescens TaxID=294 RepID=UPI0035246274
MIYLIEAFDKKTEFLAFEEALPQGSDAKLKEIMGWGTEQQGWEGYDLNAQQLGALQELLGKTIYDPAYTFQLTCNA